LPRVESLPHVALIELLGSDLSPELAAGLGELPGL
jgi:hypothetical protein